jgi:hypothetical protein
VKSGLVMPLARALGITVLLVIIKDTNVVYESWVQRHFIIDMSGTMVERIRSVGGIFKPVKSLKECPPSLRGSCGVFSPLAD